jgi:hypothetical protein
VSDEKVKEVVLCRESWCSEIFLEACRHKEISAMHFFDNKGDHLIGKILFKFVTEEDARNVVESISRKMYRGKMVKME